MSELCLRNRTIAGTCESATNSVEDREATIRQVHVTDDSKNQSVGALAQDSAEQLR
jgi:hypothetical protein